MNRVPRADKDRRLFAPDSRAMQCRQWIWNTLRKADPVAVPVTELVRERKFPASAIYAGARTLVQHGFVLREDIERPAKEKGKSCWRIALKYSPFKTYGKARRW